ncbi:expressed unknown protein [Seminavis robusta]|uniref:Uncharacterized protein n=1 Tax=Seminavis robusta TaxID=568900 RepID=A0A9N8EFQ7_9STRA|nr:expressed unknown protein [Seminavis robusta]|eukprot:Sro1027_g233010.1 n/a (156) ;mRNA; r:7588-8387
MITTDALSDGSLQDFDNLVPGIFESESNILVTNQSNAFMVAPGVQPSTALFAEQDSRRGFLVASAGAAVGVLIQGNAPALAVDDLAMPSAEEEAAQRKAEMDARIKLKAELKAKAASPKTFQDGLKAEKEKREKDKSMTQAERRNAMCEDLGRGC